jgi:DNA-binding transcriptional regulator YhcF (GntR family)
MTFSAQEEMFDGLASLEIKKASTAEQVAEALRAMILSGQVAQGRPLREVALAERIGVSRNTMREAIRILAREGLVAHELHKGAVVTTLAERDVEDIFRVRRALELAAVHALDRATVSPRPSTCWRRRSRSPIGLRSSMPTGCSTSGSSGCSRAGG